MRNFTYIGTYGLAIQDDKILLTTKKNGPYLGLLDLVGGGIEFGEEVKVALKREFSEEVAMTIDGVDWLGNFTHSGLTHEVDGEKVEFYHIGLVYLIDHLKKIENAIAQDEFDWYPIEKLKVEQLTPFAWKALKTIFV